MAKAAFSISYRDLQLLLGFPEDVRIVRVHSLPDQYVGVDGLRIVVESEAFPVTEDGAEIPFAPPTYDQRADGSLKFKGFSLLRMTVEEHQKPIEDGL